MSCLDGLAPRCLTASTAANRSTIVPAWLQYARWTRGRARHHAGPSLGISASSTPENRPGEFLRFTILLHTPRIFHLGAIPDIGTTGAGTDERNVATMGYSLA